MESDGVEKGDDSGAGSPEKDGKSYLITLLGRLGSSEPSDRVYRTLVTIRLKFSLVDAYIPILVECKLVEKLIPLLQRPNSKIVDISLSLLGNLAIHKVPREQVFDLPHTYRACTLQYL